MTTGNIKTDRDNRPSPTNQKILDAAEQLFAEKSYEATTLREIAKQVGIREPSLYAHFSNKEAIYGAVIDRALLPFYTEINAWGKTDLTLHELLAIPGKLLDLHAEHPYSAQLLHKEFTSPAERISPKIMQWLEQITEQSQIFMSGLPNYEGQSLDRETVVLHIIAFTNITLSFFSSQGIQSKLLGPQYDKSELFDAHNKIVYKIFKGLLL